MSVSFPPWHRAVSAHSSTAGADRVSARVPSSREGASASLCQLGAHIGRLSTFVTAAMREKGALGPARIADVSGGDEPSGHARACAATRATASCSGRSERAGPDESERAQQRDTDHREDRLPLLECRVAPGVALDALDGLEVRLAATMGEHPACHGREISQRAGRSLAVALKIATRSGPVLVEEGVRPTLGIMPDVHGTGYRRAAVLAKDPARARWTLFDPTRSPKHRVGADHAPERCAPGIRLGPSAGD
jgi:hypothetical protein